MLLYVLFYMLLYVTLHITVSYCKYNLHVTLNVTAHYCTRCPRRRCNLTYLFIYFIYLFHFRHYAHILRPGTTLHDPVTQCGNKHVTKPGHENTQGRNVSLLVVCCVTLAMSN